MGTSSRGAFASIALAALLVFCNENHGDGGASGKPSAKGSASTAPATSPADEAKQIAQNRCAMCHGAGGKGDGPTAATLNPKPRDLSSKDWQKSMSDAQIHSVILKGGPAIGKSVLMPANPDLEDKPAVVDELVRIVRAYAG